MYHNVIELLQITASEILNIVPDKKFTWFPTSELSPRSVDREVHYCVLLPEGKALIDAWVRKHAKIILPSDAWHAEAEKKALAEPSPKTIRISMSKIYTRSGKEEVIDLDRLLFVQKTLPAYTPPSTVPRTTRWRWGQ